jgi:hypothetical protein
MYAHRYRPPLALSSLDLYCTTSILGAFTMVTSTADDIGSIQDLGTLLSRFRQPLCDFLPLLRPNDTAEIIGRWYSELLRYSKKHLRTRPEILSSLLSWSALCFIRQGARFGRCCILRLSWRLWLSSTSICCVQWYMICCLAMHTSCI